MRWVVLVVVDEVAGAVPASPERITVKRVRALSVYDGSSTSKDSTRSTIASSVLHSSSYNT